MISQTPRQPQAAYARVSNNYPLAVSITFICPIRQKLSGCQEQVLLWKFGVISCVTSEACSIFHDTHTLDPHTLTPSLRRSASELWPLPQWPRVGEGQTPGVSRGHDRVTHNWGTSSMSRWEKLIWWGTAVSVYLQVKVQVKRPETRLSVNLSLWSRHYPIMH